MLTSKERVMRAMNHQEVDRVPLDLGGMACSLLDGVYFKLKNYLGFRENIEPFREGSNSCYYDEDVYKRQVRRKMEQDYAEELKRQIRIKAPSTDTLCRQLSGGNQQKVVVAKALTSKPRILIFDEPTQGIDVGAKAEIYELIHELAKSGTAVIVISSEMEEAIGISNRLLVMREGRISGMLEPEEMTSENTIRLMYRSE